ncbi:ATP-binding protein [Blastococcus sp. Marseille-P5729]|uniref:ATP-binding protein n=1 Tax=Blastococcus sp. Marseille-P5729 TaxID=2086582 RepID=UPI00351A10F2
MNRPGGSGETSNLPFSSWAGVFGDQVVAAAMIDRIVHHADVIALKGGLLPGPRQRRGNPPEHQSRTRIPRLRPFTIGPPKPLNFRAPSTLRTTAVRDVHA